MDISLEGWDIQAAESVEWVPWGTKGNARAKILGSADSYMVAYVQADPGYEGDPHVHGHPEFFYLVEGTVRNQGREMVAGALVGVVVRGTPAGGVLVVPGRRTNVSPIGVTVRGTAGCSAGGAVVRVAGATVARVRVTSG